MLPESIYELEEAITRCFTTTDDLALLLEHVLETEELDRDKLSNALLGLKELHDLRCQKTFDIFSAVLKNFAGK